jgi:hypothetical protein
VNTGCIYLFGGKNKDWKAKDAETLSDIQQFVPNLEGGTLNTIAHLNTPRTGFALIQLDGFIYAVGGVGSNWKKLSSVEAFNLTTKEVSNSVSSLNHPCAYMRLCVFNEKYIVKLGGGYNNNSEHLNKVELEVLNKAENKWFLITAELKDKNIEPGNF